MRRLRLSAVARSARGSCLGCTRCGGEAFLDELWQDSMPPDEPYEGLSLGVGAARSSKEAAAAAPESCSLDHHPHVEPHCPSGARCSLLASATAVMSGDDRTGAVTAATSRAA